jgi:hypothetical protein
MAVLKYWDGTQWQSLASAVADTLEWIDLGLAAPIALPWSATQMPFTVVKGGSGITVNASGQMVIQKAGVYHITATVTITQGTNYTIVNIRQGRGGPVIQSRESVAYVSGSTWDTGTVVGNFDAQVGDIFDVIVTPGGTGTSIEAGRAQFTAHRLSGPGTVAALNAASVALSFNTGAVSWGTAVPAASDGVAFTTPAGVLRGQATVTAFSTTGTVIIVEVYIDGVLVGDMRLAPALTTNAHLALGSLALSRTLTAGTHYLSYRITSGNSGNTDYGSFFGIVTSASGQLTDAATVLNLRLPASFALAQGTWTTIKGWERQHAYPGWAAETGLGEQTIPADGYYRLDLQWMSNAPNYLRASSIGVNGAVIAQANDEATAGTGHTAQRIWWEGNLAIGDKVFFNVWSGAPSSRVMPGNLVDGYAAGNYLTRAIIRKIYSGGIPAGQGSPDTPWIPMTLLNGWTNYGAPFSTLSYRRISGVVYIKGFVATGAAGTAVATLPAGFRPAQTKLLGGYYNGGMARVDIDANGVIVPSAYTSWLSLEQIVFPADQ